MSITIKDIARMINVSHTTVSRALNDSPLISDNTKKKVRKIAEKYNYQPNVSARSLVLSKSYNIGLFFSTLKKGTSANFFMDAVRGVNGITKDTYKLTVEGLDDFQNYSRITSRFFDGIILMSQSSDDDQFIEYVIKKNIPFVLLNRESDKFRTNTIIADDKVGAYNATEWLLKNGHDRIAIIEGKKEFRTTYRRKKGYIQALKDHYISYSPELAVKGNYDMESGYLGIKKLLKQKKLPTAVFCLNDDMAVGAMKGIHEQGLNIPEDISIIGFDDSIFAAYLTPSLSTVRRPIEKMGEKGATILIDQMKGEAPVRQTIYMHTELKIRESVKKINII